MSQYKYKTVIIIAVLAALVVAFIWSNSCKSQEESSAQSSAVASFLRQILDPNGRIPDGSFHHYVRKAAHFAEFAILGGLIGILFREMRLRSGWAGYLLAGLPVLLVAVLDEFIQRFTGRGSGISDVILDCFGGIFGLAIVLLAGHLKKKK